MTSNDTTPAAAPSSTPRTIAERLRLALERLAAPLPQDAIERTKGSETRKNYDTTGFGYQWIVDRMNDVLGLEGWRASATYEVSEHESKQGKAMFDATAHVRIVLGGWDEVRGEWLPWTERECIGGHASLIRADAMKGAFTNGFKKTAALYGAGASAYRGTVDDDNLPLPEGYDERGRTPKGKAAAAKRPDRDERPAKDRARPAPSSASSPAPGPAKPAGEDAQRAQVAARMKELALDPPRGLGAERCRELAGKMARDTLPQRLAMLAVLEEAFRKTSAAAGEWTVDGFWGLATRADLTEEDVRADLKDRFGTPEPANLKPAQLAEACRQMEAIAAKLEADIPF